eukprot:3824982-Rhodomonas_salina.7
MFDLGLQRATVKSSRLSYKGSGKVHGRAPDGVRVLVHKHGKVLQAQYSSSVGTESEDPGTKVRSKSGTDCRRLTAEFTACT